MADRSEKELRGSWSQQGSVRADVAVCVCIVDDRVSGGYDAALQLGLVTLTFSGKLSAGKIRLYLLASVAT